MKSSSLTCLENSKNKIGVDVKITLGYQEPDRLEITMAQVMNWVFNEDDFDIKEGILHHEEGVDLMPWIIRKQNKELYGFVTV